MIRPVSAESKDFDGAIELIDEVFRTSRGCSPTMQQEFPMLLNENNMGNMTLIKEDDRPVSVVTYLPWDISVEGSMIRSASIGAVCTAEEHRGLGYSSLILDHVEQKLQSENIDVLLVSGTRNLYKRRDLVEVESFYEYIVGPEDVGQSLYLEEYEDKCLESLLCMHSQNATRYFRTKTEFETILKSATIPWGAFSYKKYIIRNSGQIAGYIVLRLEQNETARVMELFGEPITVLNSLKQLSYNLGLKHIEYAVHIKDTRNLITNISPSKTSNQGTLKIMNFVGFMDKLRPYFSQYVSEDTMDGLAFGESEGALYINIDDQTLTIDSISQATKLVFGGYIEGLKLDKAERVENFINSVFPIPFPWTGNLNYQ